MRPLRLTLQAFGPFASTEVIDFTELGVTPLFLINGPTGSGKTSILDAICYALYGETTSNERQGSQMRCDQAPVDLLTEVSFEFALNSKSYRVTRSPEQDVPKSRGEGFTVKKHIASLYEISTDERLITSKTAQVKSEIGSLIGLNETQFRQVMVLPQGKFRELLLASSKEREAIFGQLFQTDMYKKIEYALKDKAISISKDKNDFDNQIRGALQVAEVDSEQALLDRFNTLEMAYFDAKKGEQKAFSTLDKVKREQQLAIESEQQFLLLENSQRSLKDHQSVKSKNEDLKRRIELARSAVSLSPAFTLWQQSAQQVDKLTQDLASLGEQVLDGENNLKTQIDLLSAANQAANQIPEMTEALYSLEQAKKKWVEKERLDTNIREHQVVKQALSEKLTQFEQHKQTLLNDAEYGEASLKEARVQLERKSSLEVQKVTLERLIHELNKRDELQAELVRLEQMTGPKQLNRDQDERQYQRAVRHADHTELKWHTSQAAQLAAKLVKDEPCPVCGSSEHPSPAQLTDENTTKSEVDVARASERQAQEAFNQSNNELNQHIAIYEQVGKQRQERIEALQSHAMTPLAEVQQQLDSMRVELTALNQIDVHKLEHDVQALKQRCTVGDSKIAEVKQQMSANSSSLDLLTQQLAALVISLGDKVQSLDHIDQLIRGTQADIAALNNNKTVAQKRHQDAELKLNSLSSEQKTKKTIHLDAQATLKTALEDWQTLLNNSPFASEQEYQAGLCSDEQLETWNQSVSEYHNKELQLNQTITDLVAKLDKVSRANLEQHAQEVTQKQQDYELSRDKLDACYSTYQRVVKVKQDISHLHEKNAKLEKEYQVYGTLYDVASGKTGSRVSLHRFVLGVLLDDVLIQASYRLNVMSKGRYQLTRKTEGFKGNAGRGLDLSVEDGYTGKSRDVATLSGGESFMAALSLALGLSDVVQSYSGGIRLDTLFIDEGFGSLDPESLDLALQTLIDLQQSGRMIGLISHVSELKDQMPLRIDVESSRLGSSIRLIGR